MHHPSTVWTNVGLLLSLHLGALYALTLIKETSTAVLVLAAALWPCTGLGITAGAHRLWAHRSYRATRPLQILLMLLNSMAAQGSLWDWARDHRVHHKGNDTDADPYTIRKGVFFAHIGWICQRKHPEVLRLGRQLPVRDLQEDPVVQFQRRYYGILAPLLCFGLPTWLGHAVGGEMWHSFWIAGVLRYVWVLHMTWCVNSIAHIWGERPHLVHTAANHWLVNLLTLGEGWHNYHHAFPYDYRASEPHPWNLNLTTLFLDGCARLGCVSGRKIRQKRAPAPQISSKITSSSGS